MTLDELLKRISEDRFGESETTSVLREHLGRDGYVDHKLRTALISAGIHYCPEKWDRYGTAAAAKANLIRDISKREAGNLMARSFAGLSTMAARFGYRLARACEGSRHLGVSVRYLLENRLV